MSRAEVAEEVCAWLWQKTNVRYDLDGHYVAKLERGIVRWPNARYRSGLRHVFGVSSDAELGFRPSRRGQPVTEAGPVIDESGVRPVVLDNDQLGESTLGREYVDDEYLAKVREYIKTLVSLDNQVGGSDLYRAAVRFLNAVRDRLDRGLYDRRIETDLHASVGELAEVAGWLAYDAEQHDLVRRLNQESLYFTRLAGDRSIERLTIQNASMHAGRLGRPAEALRLAASVLEGGHSLSPRLQTLFLIRKTRALAQMGDESALREFQRIRSLYLDGVADNDPAWAWWIDESELVWHEAMAKRDLGMIGPAVSDFQRSVELISQPGTRGQFVHRAYLLMAQADTSSWSDVDTTIGSIIPFTAEVSSNRTVAILRNALDRISARQSVPGRISDEAVRLRRALDSAP